MYKNFLNLQLSSEYEYAVSKELSEKLHRLQDLQNNDKTSKTEIDFLKLEIETLESLYDNYNYGNGINSNNNNDRPASSSATTTRVLPKDDNYRNTRQVDMTTRKKERGYGEEIEDRRINKIHRRKTIRQLQWFKDLLRAKVSLMTGKRDFEAYDCVEQEL